MHDQDRKMQDGRFLDECGIVLMVTKITPQGLITEECNEMCAKMTGFSREEIIGNSPEGLSEAADSDLDAMGNAIRAAKKGEPGIFASRFKHKDGTPFATRCIVTAKFDAAGMATHVIFVCTPIDADDPNLKWFGKNGLLGHAERVGGTGAFRYDYGTREFSFSNNYYKLHGMAAEKGAATRLFALMPSSQREKLDLAIAECGQTGENFDIDVVFFREDGTRHYGAISGQADCNATGDIVGMVGVLRDETEVRSLQQKQEMYLRAVKVGFIEINLQAEQVEYSADSGAIIGSKRQAGRMSMADWRARVHPDDFDEALRDFNNHLKSNQSFIRRYRFLTDDGIYCWLEIRTIVQKSYSDTERPRVVGTITDVTDQVCADMELDEIRTRLDFAVESAKLGLWSWDLRAEAKNAMSWSPQMRDILGLAADAPCKWNSLEDLLPDNERREITDAILHTAEASSKGGFHLEHRCIRPDGSEIWVENRGLAQHDEEGHVTAIAGVLQDITERKRGEVELLESQKRFHDVASITGECIFEFDADGRIIYVSEAFKAIYKQDPENVLGLMATELNHSRTGGHDQWLATIHKNHGWDNVERQITRPNGSSAWVLINGRSIVDNEGNITGFRGAISDITEQKEHLDAMVTSQQRVNEVVRMAGGCVFDLDTAGVITFISKSAKKIFGSAPEDLIGKPTYYLARDLEPHHVAWLEAIRNSDGGLEREFWIDRMDGGAKLWARTMCRVITDDSGEVIGYRGIVFDVTAQKLAETEIINAKKAAEAAAEERARFLSTMSHEIRTPLNAMIGMTDVLLEMQQNEDQRELTTSANTAGKHLLGLVNDILDFSKLDAGKLVVEKAAFDLQNEIKSVHDMLSITAKEKGLPLVLAFDKNSEGAFIGDAARIRQILVNLIGNAIKFTAKGKITLQIGKTGTGRSGRMRFAVVDTGTGINQEVLPTLFQDFAQADSSVTRKFGGTGLGLAICKRLCEVMGGEIGAQTSLGQGSTFWFEIPLPACKVSRAKKTAKPTQKQKTTIRKRELRVLVAEDNAANQLLIKTILNRLGHDVTVVENGELAVEAALADRYDVILMDVQMPKMDGVSATHCLRDAGCHTPIIALTAHVLADEEGRFREAGMDAWLSKPYDARKLVETMYYWAQKGPQTHHQSLAKSG